MSPLQLIDNILNATDSVEIRFTVEDMKVKDFEQLAQSLGLVVDNSKAYDPSTKRLVLELSITNPYIYLFLG